MKIILLCVGKTTSKSIETMLEGYEKRLKEFVVFERIEILDSNKKKSLSTQSNIDFEAKEIFNKIKKSDLVCLLDDKGKELTSVQFADFLQKKMLLSVKRIIFVVGGAFGFSDEIYAQANEKISLSKMTFTHQMVRLFFTEQLYRGFSILHNKPYHHE
jgi:23S rRNA (pseudouridine1915-N3)-methyltransferase